MWGVDLVIQGHRQWHNLGTDEQAARVAELRLRADVEEGRPVRRRHGVGLHDMASDWIAEKEAAPGARSNSIRAYKARLSHATSYLGRDIPVTDIRYEHLERMVTDLRMVRSVATVNGVVALVGAVIEYARRQGLETKVAGMRGLVGDVPARTDHPTVDELNAMLLVTPDPWAGMAEFAMLTGLRRGELLALEAGDVTPTGVVVSKNMATDGTIGPPKTRAGRRTVRLSARARDLADERVKATSGGRLWPFTPKQADEALRAAMQASGIHRAGRGWHSLRHAHAALLNELGGSLRDAAARLGHGANTAQTMAYGWASEQAGVDGLDQLVTRHDDTPDGP